MMNLEKTIGIVTKGKSVMVDMESGEYLGNCRLEKEDDKNFPFGSRLRFLPT